MTDFKKRSDEKELLDGRDIPFIDIEKNMQELEIINSRLGGHNITINGIQRIIDKNDIRPGNSPVLTICEIGCGGGDNLAAIFKWAKKSTFNIKCIGIDINPECIAYARKHNENPEIEFICSDYKKGLDTREKPGIIFSSLFCHHFNNEELIYMFSWMSENSIYGSVINDLHRHPVAYHSIRLLTKYFSKSYLVKNDAPLSVLRGFKKNELRNLIKKAEIKHYRIAWKWAFRWLVTWQ